MNQATEEKVQTRVQESLSRRVSEGEIRSLTPTVGTPGAGPSAPSTTMNPSSAFLVGGQSLDPLGSVPLPLSPDWQTEVRSLFLSEFTFRSDVAYMSGGNLEFLPDLCREELGSRCLIEALDAVSFAYVASRSSLSWLILRARQSYVVSFPQERKVCKLIIAQLWKGSYLADCYSSYCGSTKRQHSGNSHSHEHV